LPSYRPPFWWGLSTGGHDDHRCWLSRLLMLKIMVEDTREEAA
jgi:hypothetical protein